MKTENKNLSEKPYLDKKLKEEINKFGIHYTGVYKGFLCKKVDDVFKEEFGELGK
jgi:hypothetical protein